MQCANPDCNLIAQDLLTGTLRLLELDVPPEKRVIRSEWGFPICSVPSKYFWLCGDCSRFLRMKRWMPEGLILEHRTHQIRGHEDDGAIHLVAKTAYLPQLPVVLGKRA